MQTTIMINESKSGRDGSISSALWKPTYPVLEGRGGITSGFEGCRVAATNLPLELRAVFNSTLGSLPLSIEMDTLRDVIFATLLPPSASELEGVYTTLDSQLRTPMAERGYPLESFLRMRRSLAMANIILQGTTRPTKESPVMRTIPRSAERRAYIAEVEEDASKLPISAKALAAREKLIASSSDYMGSIEAIITMQLTTATQVLTEAAYVDILYLNDVFNSLERDEGDSEWNNRMDRIRRAGLNTVSGNPLSAEILTNGDMENMHLDVRREVFRHAIERELAKPEGEPTILRELGDYFILTEKTDLQDTVWEQIYAGGQLYRDMADWFFSQDASTSALFVGTSLPIGIKEWRTKEKEAYARKLVAVIADFQERNPSHRNIGVLRDSIQLVSGPLEVKDVTDPIIDVLKDDSPGVVFIKPNGEAGVKSPRSNETWEQFSARVKRELNNNRIVYQSSIPTDDSSTVQVEVSQMPDRQILRLIKGEFPIRRTRWPDVQIVVEEDNAEVLAHLGQRIETEEGGVESQIDTLVKSLRRRSLQDEDLPFRTTSIFPSLLLEENPLCQRLEDIGVAALECFGREVNVVIDAETVGIDTSWASPHVILRGILDEHNNLVFPSDGEDYVGTSLQTLLTGAALLTRLPLFTGEMRSGEIQEIRKRAKDFSVNRKDSSHPRLNADAPGESDDAALMQIGPYAMVPMTLNWK